MLDTVVRKKKKGITLDFVKLDTKKEITQLVIIKPTSAGWWCPPKMPAPIIPGARSAVQGHPRDPGNWRQAGLLRSFLKN